MKAGGCVNVIFHRVLSSNNEVPVSFFQVTPTRRGSPARCIPSICLGYQGTQIKLKVWLTVSSKPPDCCPKDTLRAPADLGCSAWHPSDTNPPSHTCLTNARTPQSIQVFLTLDLLSCSLLHRNVSCHVSLELARLVPDFPPHLSFMSCLTLQIPSGLSQLWGCGLGSRIPKSHQHQGTHQELFASK